MEIADPRASDFSQLKVTDVVFLDVMLPRGGGLQALKTIARQSSNCSIALMCGANDHPNDAVEFAEQLRLRVIGVLKKPFRHSDIEKILEGT
jgi:response regulator of citrate/malate metabolism